MVAEFEELLSNETLPEVLPITVGANCTLRLPDCPAGSVSGKVTPLMVKPDPLAPACETVRLALPELVSVTVCVLLAPTSTSPKATLVGLVLNWPFPEGGGVFWLVRPTHPPPAIARSKTNKTRPNRCTIASPVYSLSALAMFEGKESN